MSKPVNKPRKKANGYKMPDPLPNGLILIDVFKKKWKLGPSIGKGGFGEIYSAQEYTEAQKKNNTFPCVIKIEPHVNGPLFVEMHFYMRNAKPADITSFISEKKLPGLGMPKYLGSGSHEHKGEKYRFVVTEKFGSDIWKIFLENKRRFSIETVFKLGVQILDVLEYIHSKGYIHADIKGANVLTGLGKEQQTQVYLVDFGLAAHYDNNFKPDPKKAHNGTIEYLSRDAHLGVQSRRGDLEILGYNLTQWLGCVLPWEKNISDPVSVQKNKEKFMEDLPGFYNACFGDEEPPVALVDYFKYVAPLKFETDPDYKKLRTILSSGIKKAGGSMKSPLKFKSTIRTPVKRKAVGKSATSDKKAKIESEPEEDITENGITKEEKKKSTIRTPVKRKALGKSATPDKKGKIASESEEDITENEITKKEKKKPSRKTKKIQPESEEDLFEEEEELKKKPRRKNKKETKLEVDEEPGNGFTAEMQRIKDKIEAKKKPVTSSSRSMRKHANVNYNEN